MFWHRRLLLQGSVQPKVGRLSEIFLRYVLVQVSSGSLENMPSPTRGPFSVNATHDSMNLLPVLSDSTSALSFSCLNSSGNGAAWISFQVFPVAAGQSSFGQVAYASLRYPRVCLLYGVKLVYVNSFFTRIYTPKILKYHVC
jgi:hypothetical protein